MIQLMKRDWWSMWPFILFSFVFILIIYLLQWEAPNGFLFTYLLIFLLISLFYTEHKAKANRFFVSLPIKRTKLVLARYGFIFGFGHLFLLFTWIIDTLIPLGSRLSGVEFMIMIIMMNFIIAISLPIFYAIDNIWAALITQVMALIFSSILFAFIAADPYELFETFIETILYVIDFQPILVIIAVIIIILTISFFISKTIFAKKDLQ